MGIYSDDESWGAHSLGYTDPGKREIASCALPPGISLIRINVKGQIREPEQFGAGKGMQWPGLAMGRFLCMMFFFVK